VNSTLGELLEQDTRMELFVNKMLELWLLHINQLNKQWVNLDVQVDPLGYDGEQCYFFINAS
jgi:hypothetical protein